MYVHIYIYVHNRVYIFKYIYIYVCVSIFTFLHYKGFSWNEMDDQKPRRTFTIGHMFMINSFDWFKGHRKAYNCLWKPWFPADFPWNPSVDHQIWRLDPHLERFWVVTSSLISPLSSWLVYARPHTNHIVLQYSGDNIVYIHTYIYRYSGPSNIFTYVYIYMYTCLSLHLHLHLHIHIHIPILPGCPWRFPVACPFLELPQGAAVRQTTPTQWPWWRLTCRGSAAFNRGSPQISVGFLSGKPTKLWKITIFSRYFIYKWSIYPMARLVCQTVVMDWSWIWYLSLWRS